MNRLFWIVMLVIGAGLVLLMMNDSAGRTFGIQNHDFSRLIWVGVLVAVIGASLVRSGDAVLSGGIDDHIDQGKQGADRDDECEQARKP